MDPAGALTSRWYNLAAFDKSGFQSDFRDYHGHGTNMLHLAKNLDFGIIQSSRVVSLKVTEDKTNLFTEKSVVQAMRNVNDFHPIPRHGRIVNFSGFFNTTSLPVECAIQWLFYNKTAVVAAAGNFQTYLGTDSPYKITVGGFQKGSNVPFSTDPNSGYGPGVDIWAPNEFMNDRLRGTSVATTYVTVALSYYMGQFTSQLNNDPLRAYNYLLTHVNQTGISSTDARVTGTNPSTRRTVFIDTSASDTPVTVNPVTETTSNNYCGMIGLPRRATSGADWDNLIAKANATFFGQLVAGTSTSRCFGGC